jgi:hypothetical protein
MKGGCEDEDEMNGWRTRGRGEGRGREGGGKVKVKVKGMEEMSECEGWGRRGRRVWGSVGECGGMGGNVGEEKGESKGR